ncbi:AfsR/SARP family transcriptional regulator [Lentzea indica]|uniref:AfsR/SARP family transcriptional regulator n=1 Tax=Lentzea indica TaxID=2604800 RepID=UPI0014398FCB|nr:AfsR/SARP family transcriptional regulator [Lentzea indica]
MTAEYRVLGPLEVLAEGAPVPVPAGRCRVLLATLLLRPNQFVSVDELVERVWDGSPPRARSSLHMVVRRLRVALGDADCVRTLPGGYQASVGPDQLDLLRFRALVGSEDFVAAVALWRGPMLSNVVSDMVHKNDVPLVTEEWFGALERRIDVDLESGRGPDLVAELQLLTMRHPLREVLWGQLMLALAQSGQQAKALVAYQQIRGRLVNQLGVDPGERLRAVHHQVLSGSVRARGPVPRLLPTFVPRFVGRAVQLRELTGLVGRDEPMIATITGIAGVGKTMLALHWAHSVSSRFPDGQLHVNMRGFDRHREPMAPGDVLSRFLEALGVASERIPADVEAQGAMYRGLVVGRRMLLVLDNARDAEHVRPLLPGPSPSLVLITSRNQLGGLGARRLALDVLSRDEARALLVSRLGEARLDAAADELIAWCGGLPLALAIVAARAAETPQLPLSALVAELADEHTRLDSLDTGDAATSVRTVFQWSYQQLSAAAARMFRLIGVHPGPDITVPAAASLTGQSADETRACVLELVRANLLVEHVAGRYTCHDLLRVYAADRAAADESAESREAAVERMLDHYLHTLAGIDRNHNHNHRGLEDYPVPAAKVTPETFDDQPAAMAWLDAERMVIRGVVAYADEQGLDRHTWQLTWFALDMVDWFGLWREWVEQVDRASLAAARLGDRRQMARLVVLLATGYARFGRLETSLEHFEIANRIYEEVGVVAGQVRAQAGIAWVLGQVGRHHEAVEVARKSLELLRGDACVTPERMRMALHQLAAALVLVGKYEEVLECAAEWEAQEGTPAPVSSGLMATERARAFIGLGEPARAVAELDRALDWFHQKGSWNDTAATQVLLGDAHHGLGDPAAARRWWTEAVAAYEQHQHQHVDHVRAKLAALPENW